MHRKAPSKGRFTLQIARLPGCDFLCVLNSCLLDSEDLNYWF